MNKLILPLILFLSLNSYGDEFFYRMLSQVNSEWKYQDDGLKLAATFNLCNNKSFDDWIAAHLMLVEQTLRNRTIENLSSSQKQKRLTLLNELNGYWHSRAFPVNDYLPYKNPVFIDRKGNYCAVGYLMKQSGAESLAHAIDTENKFVYVKEIKTSGVKKWADENGFTLDELAWIQPGYPVSFTVQDLTGGLNGTVSSIVIDSSSQIIYAGGSFTASTTGSSCNGVAAYISGFAGWDWIGLGTGLNGNVNTLLIKNNMLYAGGDFNMAGTTPVSNVAVYDMQTGQWQSMGNLDSTVTGLAVYNNEIYAGGKFTGFVSKWTGTSWQDITQGFLYGEGVRTLEVKDSLLYIGGNFELATGALRRNVATYDGVYMGTSGFGTSTPVNDFEIHNDTLYAACDVALGPDTCALAKFDNLNWECMLNPFALLMNNFSGTSVQHLLSANQKLFCAGTFTCTNGLYYGNNLMEFIANSSGAPSCLPMLLTDSGINSLAVWGNSICFGGAFTNSLSTTLNHIGIIPNILNSVNEPYIQPIQTLNIFPNPSGDRFTIDLKNIVDLNRYNLKIMDSMGRIINSKSELLPQTSIDLSDKPGGVYFIRVLNEKGNVYATGKLMVR